ncbi:FimV/HubP family polar landmark protein [Dyella tabacisoli]|uniref:Fimbrial protein FimV n=1 Tax=Dyella tabacisoli TaxID=2282381 RepID=A0A369USG8_9GAMM|nr:FimV/HubP family polar landmark protein [Dyella tabacisoli]RDD83417.1 fimbrial protein FimV [Dyella tabacisoli]
MNRSLKLSVLLALALGSSQAVALELGQIQIKSALGQPLLAEIPLNPENPAELQNLTAKLASSDAFAQANIAAPTVLLQFSVVDGANGKKVIRVTSSAPINDPYLDLLVEVNSGANKSVREFTVLLDPPSTPAQAPIARAPTAAPTHTRTPRQAAPAADADTTVTRSRKAPAAAKSATAPAESAGDGKLGPVERGQTLSGIARRVAPAGVDVNQMLVALKQANPDAFYRDNINALKTGAVLRVPSKEDAQALATAAAMAEVSRQNSDWRAGAAKVPTTVADAGTRPSASSAPTKSANTSDRLALVPAKDGGATAAGKGSNGGKADSAALHQDLLRSQETLTALQQQGDELKSRLKDLEDINGKNERLLSLKDNEIAELQHKLAEARKSAGTPAHVEDKPVVATALSEAKPASVAAAAQPAVAASSHAAVTAPLADTPAHATTTTAATAVASTAAAPPKPVAAAAAKPAPSKPAPAPVAEEPWYMQTWAWAAGAGAVVVLALLALLGRRRKPAVVAPAANGSSLADRFGAMPVGGADPDQDELLDQLAEHPDDIGLHLELVSLYYGRRDIEHFEAAAEAMHAHISNPQQLEWQDVVSMGEDLVPGHPLFTNTAPQPPQSADEHAALHHFDLDSYSTDQGLGMPPVKPAPLPAHDAPATVSEYHFGFNLTPTPPELPVATKPVQHEPVEPIAPAPQHERTSWQFADEPADAPHAASSAASKEPHEFGHFSDDPADTKLDLARAYLDMGDPDGARSMLEEVLHEGSQMQKDTAKRLLADLH